MILTDITAELDAIGAIVRDPEDIDLINNIKNQASIYKESILNYSAATSAERASIVDRMNQAAVEFVTLTTSFSIGQRGKLERDIAERKRKIRLAGDIRNQVNQARIMAFKAKADNNPDLFQQASTTIVNIKSTALKDLRPITRLPKDIAKLDSIEESAKNYIAALNAVSEVSLTMQDLTCNVTKQGKK